MLQWTLMYMHIRTLVLRNRVWNGEVIPPGHAVHSPAALTSSTLQRAVLVSSGLPSLCPPVHFTDSNDMHGILGRGGVVKGLIRGILRDYLWIFLFSAGTKPHLEMEFRTGVRRHCSFEHMGGWMDASSPPHVHKHPIAPFMLDLWQPCWIHSCITMNLTLTMSLASIRKWPKPHLGLYTPEQQVLCQGPKTRPLQHSPETLPRVCALCGACSFPG